MIRNRSVLNRIRFGSDFQTKKLYLHEQNSRRKDSIRFDAIRFAKAKHGDYVHEPPVLKNQYIENVFLQNYLRRNLPVQLLAEIENDLCDFGERVATDIYQLALKCEFEPPKWRFESGWNSDKTVLVTCDAWNQQKDIAAQQGLISIGYNRTKYDRWSRLYQYAKLYLYASSSGLYSCPLAMTDGAAKTLLHLNLVSDDPYFFKVFHDHLTSTDPDKFWTSGQWMTEKGGGSDVGNATETVALPVNGYLDHSLYGLKWFSSATDANMALTLARVTDDDTGNVIQGSKGLGLFYVPVKENNGPIADGISMVRLKDKMGTRQLPTAELLLDGVSARRISAIGRGIASISSMLQITRLHNAISCASYIQRAYSLARDFAQKRKAFGKMIIDWPLHLQTLSRIDMIGKATAIFALETVRLLDLIEYGTATDEEKLLFRILNPLVKLYNAKVAIPAVQECIESIGGQGIIEDTGIPYLFRDLTIFAIWEGTTSVLSLDVLRSMMKSQGETLNALRSNVQRRLEPVLKADELALRESALKVSNALDELIALVEKKEEPTLSSLESGARDFAFSLCNIFISTLLLENDVVSFSSSNVNDNYKLLAISFVHSQNLRLFKTNYEFGEYSAKRFTQHQMAVLNNNVRKQ